jgi:hypothetical protein
MNKISIQLILIASKFCCNLGKKLFKELFSVLSIKFLHCDLENYFELKRL